MPNDTISFETHPERYRHWRLRLDGPIAHLGMQVQEDGGIRPGYTLKLNSYDLGVDIELADAVQRLRFEHPEVKVVVVESLRERIFCAGANIHMLAGATHPFKVNFCKFTNETRCAIEESSASSGLRWLAALSGTCAGGGYELALACDEILLVDDGSSAVSLPEIPLLAVLPGTGGLTRVVDKRKVRRDLADRFATLAEGVKGKRALEWGLVDGVLPKSRFEAEVGARGQALAALAPGREGPGVVLESLAPDVSPTGWQYEHVSVHLNGRVAEITLEGPQDPQPASPAAMRKMGSKLWSLALFRELDDALLRLRFNEPEVGVLVLRTRGDIEAVLAADDLLASMANDWFAREVTLQARRTLKRLDLTAKSLFAVIDRESCFAGSLLEVALAADQSFMLADEAEEVRIAFSPLNAGPLPMANGLTRLETRFLGHPHHVPGVLLRTAPITTRKAEQAGLCTSAPDEIDWDEEVRVAIEERASLSPDALTGMEANLRFPGPETLETKIFGRLTAWQNWVFQRPNAVGETGALTLYGKPQRPSFDWRRVG
jgi:benzoyl-CoA-dihydrodiol lyase